MTERLGDQGHGDKQDDAHGPLQQARDVIASYEEQRIYVNGRAATSTEIILAREVMRLSALSAGTRIPADVQEVIRKQMVDFGEIPDRTSPDEHPDCYLLTREEIVGAFMRVIEADRAARSASERTDV